MDRENGRKFTKSGIPTLSQPIGGKSVWLVSVADPIWTADHFLDPTAPGGGENPSPLADPPARAAAAFSPVATSCVLVAGDAWVRESARSTMPSNIGINESAGNG